LCSCKSLLLELGNKFIDVSDKSTGLSNRGILDTQNLKYEVNS
jgi:hypothetical protein